MNTNLNNFNRKELWHTSPNEIKEIYNSLLFDDCLFFSSEPYVMTSSNIVFYYTLKLSDDEVIEREQFYFLSCQELEKIAPVLNEIKNLLNCTADEAHDYLIKDPDYWSLFKDAEEASEKSWRMQALCGKAACLLGYKACQDKDEQGSVYIVPMTGRLKALTLEKIEENGTIKWTK